MIKVLLVIEKSGSQSLRGSAVPGSKGPCVRLMPGRPNNVHPYTIAVNAMNIRSSFLKVLVNAVVLLYGCASISVAMAADPPSHIRGTIVSAAPDKLIVKTATGEMTLALDASTKIAGIVPSSVDRIQAGTFVGIANLPGNEGSSALEVVVFPEAMKGSGLGDYSWDLAPTAQGGAQKSAMTNGTVKASTMADGAASTSAMTNGTVKKTSSAKGLVLTVDYGKGEKNIQVPPNVPVVTIVPADTTKLLPGAHVFIAPKADAPMSAGFVAVGIDGTVPPM
jgi:hypothetical protein